MFTGGPGAQLTLDGLTVSGCDIVLRGTFDTVRLTACTVDPGTAAAGLPPLAVAADGRPLAPSTIYVESDPARRPGRLNRNPAGGPLPAGPDPHPVRRSGANADGHRQHRPGATGQRPDGCSTPRCAAGLRAAGCGTTSTAVGFPPSAAILAANPRASGGALGLLAQSPSDQRSGLPNAVLTALDSTVSGTSFFNATRFAGGRPQSRGGVARQGAETGRRDSAALNLGLLQDAYPVALAPAAVALARRPCS